MIADDLKKVKLNLLEAKESLERTMRAGFAQILARFDEQAAHLDKLERK